MYSNFSDEAKRKLASFLKQLRGERSQRDFCQEFGDCTIATYSAWETQKAFPSTAYLRAIACYANQDFNQFIEWLEPINNNKKVFSINQAVSCTNYLNENELVEFVQILLKQYFTKENVVEILISSANLIGNQETKTAKENFSC